MKAHYLIEAEFYNDELGQFRTQYRLIRICDDTVLRTSDHLSEVERHCWVNNIAATDVMYS